MPTIWFTAFCFKYTALLRPINFVISRSRRFPQTRKEHNTIIVEGSCVPRGAELGVPFMPAFFVTYQGPQRLMQDCLWYWADSQYIPAASSSGENNLYCNIKITQPSFRQSGMQPPLPMRKFCKHKTFCRLVVQILQYQLTYMFKP